MPLLEELLYILEDNPKMRIEIDGHICCNLNTMDTKLSFRRAIVIFKYLIDNGIPVGRLAYKGFGSNVPIYRLPERNEEERAANRRVEILVVEKE
jgi:outer membrane protein OmpA-like peptidoglycan-associated protein